MTIIAYHNGVLIGDRLGILTETEYHSEIIHDAQKVFLSECGKYGVGVCGATRSREDINLFMPALISLSKGEDISRDVWTEEISHRLQMFDSGILFVGGEYDYIISTKQPNKAGLYDPAVIPREVPVFMGSGEYLAQYAFFSGCSLIESVKLAGKYNPLTGETFDVVTLPVKATAKGKVKTIKGRVK